MLVNVLQALYIGKDEKKISAYCKETSENKVTFFIYRSPRKRLPRGLPLLALPHLAELQRFLNGVKLVNKPRIMR